jgi:hypothetical protein
MGKNTDGKYCGNLNSVSHRRLLTSKKEIFSKLGHFIVDHERQSWVIFL